MMKIGSGGQRINNFVGKLICQELLQPAAKLFPTATPFAVVWGGFQELQLSRTGEPKPRD